MDESIERGQNLLSPGQLVVEEEETPFAEPDNSSLSGEPAEDPPPPSLRPDVQDMMSFVEWQGESTTSGVLTPQCGGLFLSANNSEITPWVGTDPDAEVNCFSWNTLTNKWVCPVNKHNEDWTDIQGPVHPGQHRPTKSKSQRET